MWVDGGVPEPDAHRLEQSVGDGVLQYFRLRVHLVPALGHKKLDTTALYARVATKTIRAVTSPIEALKLLNWRMAWKTETGQLTPADASSGKVYGSECDIESYRSLLEVVGRAGFLRQGSPGAELAGILEKAYRGAPVRTFGGGSNEVQREILAQTALGLPRSKR